MIGGAPGFPKTLKDRSKVNLTQSGGGSPLQISFPPLLWVGPGVARMWCAVRHEAEEHTSGLSDNVACPDRHFMGPWQARLSKDSLGSASPWLARIISTHWIRTLLINAYGLILLTLGHRMLRANFSSILAVEPAIGRLQAG
jgi:hypothetical protein